jgi:ElaB/YqjD/DUF883 family membrane-anchored ribosome-binding protein
MDAKTDDRGFNRAMGEAKRQAENIRDSVNEAVSSASGVADAATTAVKKTAGSFERAAREIIENQPYTAVMIALGIGWLLGRTRHPF